MSESHVPIEIIVSPDDEGGPGVEPHSRIDVLVNDRLYPTARLDDGRYVAWWFDTEAPEPDDPATTEWIVAPTRYLAAVTLRELWEDPAAFDSVRPGNGDGGSFEP